MTNNKDAEKEKKNKNVPKGVFKFCIVLSIAALAVLLCKTAYAQYQIYDFQKRYKEAPSGAVIETGKLNLPRSNHSAVRLQDGNILVAGGNKGAELFNPNTGRYKLINKTLPEFDGSSLNSVLLPNGNVLIAGFYLFDSAAHKIYPVNNIEKYISENILNYDSISPILTPIVISDKKVLVIIEYPDFNKVNNKFLLYDIDKNIYETLSVNIDDENKKYLSGRLLCIKKDNFIHFISSTTTGVYGIKWDYNKNQIIDIKNYSPKSFKQLYIINDNNILMNNIDETVILNTENSSIYQIKKLDRYIYAAAILNDKTYIFTSENSNQDNPNGKINIFTIKDNEISRNNIGNINDAYGYSYKYFRINPQYIVQTDNNGSFLISGGQAAIPKSSRIKNSVIIKGI